VALQPAPGRVPIWIGGRGGPALRRAARFDGWIADSADPARMTVDAGELARKVAVIRAHRGALEGFDVAVLGYSGPGATAPEPYAEAGATWWLESVHDLRGDRAAMRALVEAGPPA
jgi:hypothetical protein